MSELAFRVRRPRNADAVDTYDLMARRVKRLAASPEPASGVVIPAAVFGSKKMERPIPKPAPEFTYADLYSNLKSTNAPPSIVDREGSMFLSAPLPTTSTTVGSDCPPPPPPPHPPASSSSSRPHAPLIDFSTDGTSDMELERDLFSGSIWDEIMTDVNNIVDVYNEKSKEDTLLATGLPYQEGLLNRLNAKRRYVRGDLLFREFMNNFSLFHCYRYGPQMDVIRACAGALIPQMFQDTFDIHRERIIREYGITDFRKEVLATMPRRTGKTHVAGQIEANCLYTFGGRSAVFAAYFFQSGEFKAITHTYVCQLPGGKDMCVINNKHVLMVSKICSKEDEHGGLLYAFAGRVNAARGFTAIRIYYDEASFADPEFITSNVFAGMLLAYTFVFMISSPPDQSNNVFNQLCHALFEGKPVFKWIRLEALCQDCARNKALKCPHLVFPRPPWQAGEEERAVIEAVLGKIDPRRYRIEIMGVAEGQDVDAFEFTKIERLIKLPKIRLERCPQFVAISVDPSGAGDSDLGLTAMAMDSGGRTVILGADSVAIKSTQSDVEAAVDFARRLRVRYRNAFFIYIVEANYGGTPKCGEFIRHLSKNKPFWTISQDVDGLNRPGIWVTHDYKERFVQHWNELLDEDRLAFAEHIETKHEDAEALMIEQMRNFRRIYNKPSKANPGADPKIPFIYSGKGRGKTDDWMMSALEGAYFLDQWHRNPGYMARAGNLPIGHAEGAIQIDGRGFASAKWVRPNHEYAPGFRNYADPL